VTGPVRPPTPANQAWAELAAGLTPANSLARVDTVTARAVTTVTVVGLLLTGLGAASTALPGESGTARDLAVVAVITAALAVAAALTAQLLTITRGLNPANLAEVRAWYRRQFELRAYPAQAATVLLLISVLLAGAAAAATLLASPPGTPALTITQTLGPVNAAPATDAAPATATDTVTVTFPGLSAGQTATLLLTTPGTARPLARAAATAGSDGTAPITLTARLPAAQTLIVTTAAPGQTCQATLAPDQAQPAVTCGTR
jgi:hypothetical protein